MTNLFDLPRALVLPCLVALILPLAAQAQQQPLVEEDEPDPQQNEMMNFGRMNGWTDETFDQWVFGSRTPAAARTRLNSLLTLQIEDVDRTCSLTPEQKTKLELAGKGDVKHLYDRVAEKKRKFQAVKNDQNKIGNIFQEIQPLQSSFNSGPFDEGSIFFKAITNTLEGAQKTKYEDVLSNKRLFRYRAKVDLTVAFLDNAVGFKADQRKKLSEILLAETKPPRRYGQYDYYVVMWQAAHLPEAKLKPLFDETQWKLLNRQLIQAKGMGQFLKQNGYADDMPGDAAPKALEANAAVEKVEVKKDEEKKDEVKKDEEKKAEVKKPLDRLETPAPE